MDYRGKGFQSACSILWGTPREHSVQYGPENRFIAYTKARLHASIWNSISGFGIDLHIPLGPMFDGDNFLQTSLPTGPGVCSITWPFFKIMTSCMPCRWETGPTIPAENIGFLLSAHPLHVIEFSFFPSVTVTAFVFYNVLFTQESIDIYFRKMYAFDNVFF